ncbi:MAG: response regulator transcription factor [Propionibacteriaceae bacterium]|nr:response regulator transcription factor [Propionibacteriaceae bacterium]
MAKVAVGDFDAMLAIGIRDVVTTRRMDVIHRPTAAMLEYLHDCLPQLVVLDAGAPGSVEVIRRIVAEYPSIQVVTCSAHDPTLRVYPPFHHGESFETSLSDLPLDG